MADKYEVVTSLPGYYTSRNAISGSDRRNTVKPATYYIYKVLNGAINITSKEGVSGVWINPSDNVKPAEEVVDTQQSEIEEDNTSSVSSTDTSLSYSTSTAPALASSSGTNKKVYSPTKDYIPCYIANSLVGGRIEFECEPEEISDNMTAQFDAQEVRGRSNPFQGYNDSGPRSISFSVVLHDDLCALGILATVNRLKSLAYPDYGFVLKAPRCIIRIGDMINCTAVVTDVSVTWKKPFRNGVYVTADVDISALEVVNTPFSTQEIWSNGGYR